MPHKTRERPGGYRGALLELSQQLPTPTPASVAARVSKPDVRDGFTKLPNAILLNSSLSAVDCRLYALLAHHQGSNAESWPSQKLLATELDVSESTVRRGLRRLEAAELVKTRQVGLRRTNRYTVLNPGSVTTDDAQQGCSANLVNMPERSSVTVPRVRRTSKPVPPPTSSSIEESVVVVTGQQAKSHHGVSGYEEIEETQQPAAQPQLADSHSSFEYDSELLGLLGLEALALDSQLTLYEQDSPGLGIEPRPVAQPQPEQGERMEVEGVVSHLRANAQGYHWLVFEDGREFPLVTPRGMPYNKGAAEVLKLYGKHVRFPVGVSGNVAGRPKVVVAERAMGQIDAEKNSHGGERGLEQVDVGVNLKDLREATRAAGDESRPAVVSEPMPWDSRSQWDAWERQQAVASSEPDGKVEPLPREPDLSGVEERLSRRFDEGIEKVVTVVIAASGVGEGEVVEGAQQVLIDHEGRQDE